MTITLLAAAFFCLLLVGLPMAFCIGISAVVASLTLPGVDPLLVVQRMLIGMNSFPLLAIPFFILTGNILSRGGITNRIVRLAEVFVGRVRGSLALVNCLDSMIFGGVSGSAIADVASLGPIVIPAMVENGYPRPYAVALTVTTACMGPIIPPSIPMIIYASVVGTVSIAGLFLTGLVPGVLIGLGLMVVCYIQARIHNYGTSPRMSFAEALRRVGEGVLGLFTIVIILGGIIAGFFTATESAVVAALYALLITVFVYREFSVRDFVPVIRDSAITTAVVMFTIGLSSAFSWILTYVELPKLITSFLRTFEVHPTVLLVVLNVVLLITGCLIDLTPAIIMFVPLFAPICESLGMHPLQIGAMIVLNLVIGLVTPPVGVALWVGCKVGNISLHEPVRDMVPFLLWLLVVLGLVTYVPAVSLSVPRMFGLM